MKRFGLIIFVVMFFVSSSVFAKVGGGNITFDVKGSKPVIFSHDGHVGMGLNCQDCHDKLFVTKEKHKKATMKNMKKGKSCGACHNGKKAFSVKSDCNKCHK